jgi:hypothetical protein
MSPNPTGSDPVLYVSVALQGKHHGFHLQCISKKTIPVQTFCVSACILFNITGLTKLPLRRRENQSVAKRARKYFIFGVSQYVYANTKLLKVKLSLCVIKYHVMEMYVGLET